MRGKKGQMIFLSLMLGLTFFLIGLMIAPAISNSISNGRTTMDCSNTSIDTSQKINCTAFDLVLPYVIATIFGLAGGLVGATIQS